MTLMAISGCGSATVTSRVGVFQDGYAWDGGDRWTFHSGLSLKTAPGYELPYTDDDPGGWTSNIAQFCLDAEGRITAGPGPGDR
jgi:hypothetical protein